MEIILVRHGQTDYNARRQHQDPQASLNARGRMQAVRLVKEIRALNPTHIISSDMPRAVETAVVIKNALSLPHTPLPFFAEIYRPRSMVGVPHVSVQTIVFLWRWFFVTDDSYWQSKGGESRAHFFLRLQAAQRHLSSLPPDARVVVVSHSFFITVFVRQLCMENIPTFFQTLWLLLWVRRLDNSSWSLVTYNPMMKGCDWRLESFDNDRHVIKE